MGVSAATQNGSIVDLLCGNLFTDDHQDNLETHQDASSYDFPTRGAQHSHQPHEAIVRTWCESTIVLA